MDTHWEWRIWGRTVHPFSMGVWIAVTTVAVFLGLFGEDTQEYVFQAPFMTRAVGSLAAISSLLFLLGFIFNKWVFLSWALMLAAVAFISRVALYAMDIGVDSFPLWISLSLSFTAIGAWMLERDRHG